VDKLSVGERNDPSPAAILALILTEVQQPGRTPFIAEPEIMARVTLLCRDIRNRACIRFVMACSLAKIHHPAVDIRSPYTEIHAPDAYSGRTYDERYLTPFILEHKLPCNNTTAFLTPAFRNHNRVLTPDIMMVGRPEVLYKTVLELLTDVQDNRVSAQAVLAESIRLLIIIRDEQQQRLQMLLANLSTNQDLTQLSAAAIVTLISQHLSARRSSRLPVLVVAAAYYTAANALGISVMPLEHHNAADEQTEALGDLEIVTSGENPISAVFEMKTRRITLQDLDQAVQKLRGAAQPVDQYIFITTEEVSEAVSEYAADLYNRTDSVEFAIFDCLSFLRHYLHLFHQLRGAYLEMYQSLVLAEPDSAVNQPLKEAFLALRQAAESDPNNET